MTTPRQCSGMLAYIWGKVALRHRPRFLKLYAEACSANRPECSLNAAHVLLSGF